MVTPCAIAEPVRRFYYDDEMAKAYYESEEALGPYHVWLAELLAGLLGQNLWFYTAPVWDASYECWKVWFVSSDHIPEGSREICLRDERRNFSFVLMDSQETHSV